MLAMSFNLEHHANEIKDRGYTVVPDILTPAQITSANEVLEAIFEKEKEIGPLRNWHNGVYKVAYMLPQKHEIFRTLPMNPVLLQLMRALLGKDCVLSSLNGLTMSPGGDTQKLHNDAPRTPFNCLAINALHCLDDFTKENGATRLVPGSHNQPFDPLVDTKIFEKDAIYVEAPAGSLLAYNGGLLHAGSANRTQGRRRALHAFFCRHWVEPQWDYTKSLTPEVVATMSPEQKALFAIGKHMKYYDAATDNIFRNNKPEKVHEPARA